MFMLCTNVELKAEQTMKIFSTALNFFSKSIINNIFSSCEKLQLSKPKNFISLRKCLVFSVSTYRCMSVNTSAFSVETLFQRSGKQFQETENEYAHKVMEDLPYYSKSICVHPMHQDKFIFKNEKSSENLNAVERFIHITIKNLSEGSNIENEKFTNIIQELCSSLHLISNEEIKNVLHYLSMWPPAPSTKSQRFKILWNTLDEECVKRLKQWNDIFCKKFSKMSHKNNHFVFVYGTLKRGEPNHDLIESRSEGVAMFVGNAKTVKKWPLVIASRYNIPYLLYCEGRGEYVCGEVYELNDVMLSKFDELECHPKYYTRLTEEVQMITENKEIIKPWIYFLKNFRPELLNLPFMSNYSSKGSHGLEYVSRYKRNSKENYYSDVMNL